MHAVLCLFAVIFQSDSLEEEASETQYYYPATIADGAGTMVTNVHTADSILSQPTSTGNPKLYCFLCNPIVCFVMKGVVQYQRHVVLMFFCLFLSGQLYVMMSPQDVLATTQQRSMPNITYTKQHVRL